MNAASRVSNKFIVKPKFVVDYLQHLEVIEFKKKEEAGGKGKGKMMIIIGLLCAKMPPS